MMRKSYDEGFLNGFSFSYSLDLGSLLESETTEEEDLLAELTRQMANSTIEDNVSVKPSYAFSSHNTKESYPGLYHVYVDAGEVCRMRMNHSRGLLVPQVKPNPYRSISWLQFQQMKQQQHILKQKRQGSVWVGKFERPKVNCNETIGLNRPHPMHGSSGMIRECAGTGVFLPRLPDTRKRTDVGMRVRNNYSRHHQKPQYIIPRPVMDHDIRLPQEWTY